MSETNKALVQSAWTIEEHGKGYVLYSGRDNMYHGMNLVYLSEPDWQWEKTKALIEAAPDLLRVCELVQFWLLNGQSGPYSSKILLDLVELAINKAKKNK